MRRSLKTCGVGAEESALLERGGRTLVNFSSNDYLGLTKSRVVIDAFREALDRFGAGSGASRLICGTHGPHEELEDTIAKFKRTDAALAFSSGYAAAVGAITSLLGKGDVVILDKLAHASLVDGARLSGATIRVFPHNHLAKLERLLGWARDAAGEGGRVLVVTESVFSMDGDRCALREIVDLKNRHGAMLLLDEAHALGVIGPGGRGLAEELGVRSDVDLHMGTLSKAVGLSGGYIAARQPAIDLMVNRARSLIYSTAPPPALAFAAAAALRLVESADGDARREKLWANIRLLADALGEKDPSSPIFPVILGGEERALRIGHEMLEAGYLAPAIRYPTVAKGTARLRVTVSALHRREQILGLADALRTAMKT